MGNGTTDPQNEEFSSTDVELARLTKEVLDTLQVPERVTRSSSRPRIRWRSRTPG